MSLEFLIRGRKTIGDKVELLRKSVGLHTTHPLSQGTIKSYIDDLLSYEKKLDINFDKISKEVDDANFPAHEREYLIVIQKITSTKGELENLKSIPANTKFHSPVQRPSLELPKFSGERDDWSSFYAIFKASVEDDKGLTDAERLQYLLRCVNGPPKDTIKHFPIIDSSYGPAMNLLKDGYTNKRLIVHDNIEKFLSLPQLTTESVTGLQKMIDSTYQGIAVLVNQGEPANQWGTLVTHILIKKLDPKTRELFESQQPAKDIPSYDRLIDFLKKRIGSLRMFISTAPKSSRGRNTPVQRETTRPKPIAANHSTTGSCPVCDSADHFSLVKCQIFIAMQLNERRALVRTKQLCFNCLRPGHGVAACESSDCRKCHKRHHTLLHPEIMPPSETEASTAAPESVVSSHYSNVHGQVLLATAVVKMNDNFGNPQLVRALLDPGSQASFITEDCVRRMKLKRKLSTVHINGIGSSSCTPSHGTVNITVSSHFDSQFNINVRALILPSVTGLLPSATCTPTMWSHLTNLQLADPLWFKTDKVDILLGSDIYFQIIQPGIVPSIKGSPVAVLTTFGWILGGPTSTEVTTEVVNSHVARLEVEELLQRFWELDHAPLTSTISYEEERSEQHFKDTVSRDKVGRYVVRLPFKAGCSKISCTKDLAMRRLLSMEKRLHSHPELHRQYVAFMKEYEELGHMQKVQTPLEVITGKCFYFPHHAVVRPDSSSTKIRVVFDGSAKGRFGSSLNDALMVGPKIQEDLIPILIRFRVHLVALKADIEKMYSQIRVDERDQDFQRILWRENPSHAVDTYRLTTVTYGTASAPFQAIRALRQLALDEQVNFPDASGVVLRDFYVDDLMSGASSTQDAVQLQLQLVLMLAAGKFPLRKWSSNDPDVLAAIPEAFRDTADTHSIDADTVVKTLGIQWHPGPDAFSFKVSPVVHGSHTMKRIFLSEVSKIFDPLGWLSPVIIKAKILFQRLWVTGLGWDDKLPLEVEEVWAKITSELHCIELIRIPRCISQPTAQMNEIHGFSDASELAYGAAVYLRTISSVGNILVRLICAKTRVAPTKKVTLPRLELCGALLLSKLMVMINSTLPIPASGLHAWTDSTIVLHWLNSHPNRWQTFVANRVAQIQSVQPALSWHHVPGKDNPADCASRGIFPNELNHHPLWWSGPAWLSEEPVEYDHVGGTPQQSELLEEKKLKVTVATVVIDLSLLDRYSSLGKLKRVSALCLRFRRNCYFLRN